jgi:arabinosyltransferase C
LRDYIARHSPVLVAWPIAFVFPCAVKPVEVHDGLAQAPVSVIEAPQQFSGLSAASTDDTIGGTFAPLREPGTLGEVTTRLNGRPDADWGNLMLTTYPDTRDDYQTTITWRKVSGFHGTDTTPAPPTRPSAP